MLRLLSDECFNRDIIRGLVSQAPTVDIVRVQEVGLRNVEDPRILAWAADHQRVLLTHDRKTVPAFARERTKSGLPMPGVFVVDDHAPIGKVIEPLLLIEMCSEPYEWVDQVKFLPF